MRADSASLQDTKAHFYGEITAVFLIIAAVVLAVYGNTLKGGFVYDDILHIVENRQVTETQNPLSAFGEALPPGNLYRPLLIISYAATRAAAGLAPLWFHAGNIALHVLAMFFLYLILARYLPSGYALIVTLICAVHPTPSEAVANISGRSELLVHFFGLAFLVAVLRRQDGRFLGSPALHYCIVNLLFLAALFSKESAVSYALLLWLLLNFRSKPLNILPGGIRLWAGLAACTAVYAAMRVQAVPLELAFGGEGIDFVDNPLAYVSWIDRILNASYLLTRYLVIILVPYRQSADYSFAQFVPLSPSPGFEQLLSIAIPFVLLYIGAARYRRGDLLGLFVLWFFAAFAVSSNVFFAIGTVFADRLTYLACPAVIAGTFLAVSGARGVKRFLLPEAYFLLCAVITLKHNPVWRDNLSLWAHQMRVAPFSVKSPANYGAALLEAGRPNEALPMLLDAERLNPVSDGVQRLLSEVYTALGDKNLADLHAKKASELDLAGP